MNKQNIIFVDVQEENEQQFIDTLKNINSLEELEEYGILVFKSELEQAI